MSAVVTLELPELICTCLCGVIIKNIHTSRNILQFVKFEVTTRIYVMCQTNRVVNIFGRE